MASSSNNNATPPPTADEEINQIIRLKLRDDLAQCNIVNDFLIDLRTQSLKVDLNGKYNNVSVLADFAIKPWSSNVNNLELSLKKKSVKDADIRNIINTLDSNNAHIVDSYFDIQEKLEQEEKRKAKELETGRVDEVISFIKEKVVDTFLDEARQSIALVKVGDHVENRFIEQDSFKDWIGFEYYEYAQEQRQIAIQCNFNYVPPERASVLTEDEIKTVQSALKYEAIKECSGAAEEYVRRVMCGFRGRSEVDAREIIGYPSGNGGNGDESGNSDFDDRRFGRKLHLRIASYIDTANPAKKKENYVLYDIGDETWNYVKVTANGVSIVKSTEQSPTPFKRYSINKAQVYPKMDYPPDILDRFMKNTNVYKNHQNKLLSEVYLISLFMLSNEPKPIMVPNGPQGTGKSTFQEHCKMTIDPSAILTITAHSKPEEVIQALSHSYLTVFDNISEIKDWLSDLLCRVVTGTGFSKRMLWTDDKDFVYSLMRAVGFNGINITATKADLLERILKITLDPINKEDREKLAKINSRFEEMLPHLLGFIFDTISKVLSRLGEVNLRELPRMADWAELGELIARVLGYEPMEFINAYNNNLGLTSAEAVDADPVATAADDFMQKSPIWGEGSARKLIKELNEHEIRQGHGHILRSKEWPKSANKLADKLNTLIPELQNRGIIYNRVFNKNTRTYDITLVNQFWKPKSSEEQGEGEWQ